MIIISPKSRPHYNDPSEGYRLIYLRNDPQTPLPPQIPCRPCRLKPTADSLWSPQSDPWQPPHHFFLNLYFIQYITLYIMYYIIYALSLFIIISFQKMLKKQIINYDFTKRKAASSKKKKLNRQKKQEKSNSFPRTDLQVNMA